MKLLPADFNRDGYSFVSEKFVTYNGRPSVSWSVSRQDGRANRQLPGFIALARSTQNQVFEDYLLRSGEPG